MARFIPHVVTFDLSPLYNCCSHRKSLSECAGTVLQNSAGTQTQIHTLMLSYWWALTQRSDLVETQPERKWFPVIKTVFNLIVLFFLIFYFTSCSCSCEDMIEILDWRKMAMLWESHSAERPRSQLNLQNEIQEQAYTLSGNRELTAVV